ncbi:MAG: hypothetical protein LKJ47_05090 [Bifidobacteriaceae bacterium]|jgi:hypothetical protein|nr:hypothetical protein [Bifidobacteriaceae bacterium]
MLTAKDRRLNTIVILVLLVLAFTAGVVLLLSTEPNSTATTGVKSILAGLLLVGSLWGFAFIGFGFWINHPYILKDRAYTKAFAQIWDEWKRTDDAEACYWSLLNLDASVQPTTPEYSFFYHFNLSTMAFKSGRSDEALMYFNDARRIEYGYHRRKHIKQMMRAVLNAQAADKEFAELLKK